VYLIRDVIDNNDAVSATIVARSDRAEAFLAGSIPDLQFNSLSLEFDCADLLQRVW
jgi:hypothetical protein